MTGVFISIADETVEESEHALTTFKCKAQFEEILWIRNSV